MSDDNRKQTGKRLLRTFLLLLSSLLIVSATASVINVMYMDASPISVEDAKVKFVTAGDSEAAGADIGTDGTYVSFNSMSGWPNAIRTYQAAVGIMNSDEKPRTIELKLAREEDWSGDTDKIDYIRVIVRDTAEGTQQGETIDVGTPESSTGPIDIPANTTWVVEWNIKWNAGALSTDTVSVRLTLIVMGE